MDSAYKENPVQLGLLDSWSVQQSVCNVSWTWLEQTKDFINAMEIQNFFRSAINLLLMWGLVPLQEFSPVKFRTDGGQLDADNKEPSTLVQDWELEGLLSACSSLSVHFFVFFYYAQPRWIPNQLWILSIELLACIIDEKLENVEGEVMTAKPWHTMIQLHSV